MMRRILCALTGALAAAAILALRGAAETRMAQSWADAVELVAAGAVAGALILPGRVWPAARGWLRPLVGGLLLAPVALLLALLPDAIGRLMAGGDALAAVVWLVVGAVWALAIAGPVCAGAAIALHGALRLSSPS
jgi:hypothetical protein